jgi:hypothetical protein
LGFGLLNEIADLDDVVVPRTVGRTHRKLKPVDPSQRFRHRQRSGGSGLRSSVAHPGGNITGFSYIDFSMLGKALQLLKQVAPSIDRVGLLRSLSGFASWPAAGTRARAGGIAGAQ